MVKVGIVSPAAQQTASGTEEDDAKVRDTRQVERLTIVRTVRECKLSEAQLGKVGVKSREIYDTACVSAAHKLTLDELKVGFPEVYRIHVETQSKAYLTETPDELVQADGAIARQNYAVARAETQVCLARFALIVSGDNKTGTKPRTLTEKERVAKMSCFKKLHEAESAMTSGFMERMALKLIDWLPSWVPDSWRIWMLGAGFGAVVILLHAIPAIGALLVWLGLRKKTVATTAVATAAATKTSSSDFGLGTPLLIAVAIGGTYWYMQREPSQVAQAATVVTPPAKPFPANFLTQEELRTMNAYITNPQGHPFAGRPLDIRYGQRFGDAGPGRPLVVSVGESEYVIGNPDACPHTWKDGVERATCTSEFVLQEQTRAGVYAAKRTSCTIMSCASSPCRLRQGGPWCWCSDESQSAHANHPSRSLHFHD